MEPGTLARLVTPQPLRVSSSLGLSFSTEKMGTAIPVGMTHKSPHLCRVVHLQPRTQGLLTIGTWPLMADVKLVSRVWDSLIFFVFLLHIWGAVRGSQPQAWGPGCSGAEAGRIREYAVPVLPRRSHPLASLGKCQVLVGREAANQT